MEKTNQRTYHSQYDHCLVTQHPKVHLTQQQLEMKSSQGEWGLHREYQFLLQKRMQNTQW